MTVAPAASGSRTRRRADGRPSARALLLSLLGEHVVPNGGEAWTSTLIGAFEALGVEEKAARQALARSEAAGWLTHETEGRYTRWRVTPSARALVTSASERLIRSLQPEPWDGRWLLVSSKLTGDERQALGARLAFEGFGSLASGLWVAFDRHAKAAALDALASLGDRGGLVFEADLEGDAAVVVGQAWDLAAADEASAAFLERFADVGVGDDAAAFAVSALLGHEWQELLRESPDLPEPLQPPGWRGRAARDRFVELYREVAAPADRFYASLTASVDM